MVERFHSFKYAPSILLVFIGAKIFVADTFGLAKIPVSVSLSVTLCILAAGGFLIAVEDAEIASNKIGGKVNQ